MQQLRGSLCAESPVTLDQPTVVHRLLSTTRTQHTSIWYGWVSAFAKGVKQVFPRLTGSAWQWQAPPWLIKSSGIKKIKVQEFLQWNCTMAVHLLFWKGNFSNKSGPEYSSKIRLLGHPSNELLSMNKHNIHRLTYSSEINYCINESIKINITSWNLHTLVAGITCYYVYASRNCQM